MTPVTVAKHVIIPFFPMRPIAGPRLSPNVIAKVIALLDSVRYVWQPKLDGDRAILSVVQRGVLICNRHGGLYGFRVNNAQNFLKLKDGSCFDGEVKNGLFYPFEAVALEGRSLRHNTTEERVIMAEQMCHFLKIDWKFAKPTADWLLDAGAHRGYDGIVRKNADAGYNLMTSAGSTSQPWRKFRFLAA